MTAPAPNLIRPHINTKMPAPAIKTGTGTTCDLWEWSDFLGIPASTLLSAAQKLVGGDA